MKTWRNVQKVAVTLGLTYGLWLGCNVDATSKDSTNAFVIVVLAVIMALTLCLTDEDGGQVKSL